MLTIKDIPTNFNDIKTNLLSILGENGYDTNFEGSNASILTDLMAYIATIINLNTSFNTSEMLLSTASQEKNVRQISRQLGYEGQYITSYKYNIRLKCVKDTSVSDNTKKRTYNLPRFSLFNSNSNEFYNVISYETSASNNDIDDNLDNAFIDVLVVQGTYKTYTDVIANDGTNSLNYIDVPYTNVEDSNILAFINGIEYSRTSEFLIDTDINVNNKFFRLDDIDYGTPRLYFMFAGMGEAIDYGTNITVICLESKGNSGSGSSTFTISDATLSGLFQVDSVELVSKGQSSEDIESMRVNAPLFHNSANRAVTENDYVSICNKHNNVRFTKVWGGEEEIPEKLGNIFFSFIPEQRYNSRDYTLGNYMYTLDNIDSSDNFIKSTELYSPYVDTLGNVINPGVFDILNKYAITGLSFNHRNPIYVDFSYIIKILKHSIDGTVSKAEMQSNVFDIINNYFLNYIENGNLEYFDSNIVKLVDTYLGNNVGVNITTNTKIKLYKENINSERDLASEKNIVLFLAAPYVDFINGESISTSSLPSIDTTLGQGQLITDWTNTVINRDSENNIISFETDVTLDSIVVGKYYVNLLNTRYIRIDFYVKGSSTVTDPRWTTSTLLESYFDSVLTLNLNYSLNNMGFFRNTYPRLSSVQFI